MNNISKIKDICCGCRACFEVCPKEAIAFKENSEGFSYPIVDNQKCVSCGLCKKACPIINLSVNKDEQKGYAAFAREPRLLQESSSGGIFAVLALNVLSKKGVVVGCGYDENNMPRHTIVREKSELYRIQGSKYAQSNMESIMGQVLEELKKGRTVLFSGTPCQVAGLKNTIPLKWQYNLYTCDLICHGVPSRLLLKKYFQWLEKKNKGMLISYNFRSKKRNDWSLTYRAEINKGSGRIKVIENIASIDPYYNSFLEAENYRRSCYSCPYSKAQRCGDITIGDFWGVEEELPDIKTDQGVSAVLINTEKGRLLFGEVSDQLMCFPVLPEQIIRHNGNLNFPSKCPDSREKFYRILLDGGFEQYYVNFKKTKKYKIEILRNLLSNRTRQNIKRLVKRGGSK